MPKSARRKTKDHRVMNAAQCNPTTTEIPQLTELQKGFEAQLTAASLLGEAITTVDETTQAARYEKISAWLKQMLPASPAPPATTTAITELAKTTLRDLKTAEDKAKESKDALTGVRSALQEMIAQFEKQHCADAIQVYSKSLAEIRQGEVQKREIEQKIAELQECCAHQEAADE
jgi:hypothetical protein